MNDPGAPPARQGEPPLSPIVEAEPVAPPLEGGPAPVTPPASQSSPPSVRDFFQRLGLASKPIAPTTAEGPHVERPTFFFFGIVAGVSLLADVSTKAWAEVALSRRLFTAEPSITLIKDHLTFTLAYNEGGAWGLLSDASETIRRPFFFAVSVLAVLFIVSLYSKLVKGQHSLTWGLPFVLGGALGNLSDRVTRNSVVDFIDYRADWVLAMNRGIAKGLKYIGKNWGLTDHWPTFNIADVAICIGVGLMAVDMFTSRRGPERREPPPLEPVGASNPPVG
ncbi:MAG TPA: signal peptidase II [Polyangiaceae bacterium]